MTFLKKKTHLKKGNTVDRGYTVTINSTFVDFFSEDLSILSEDVASIVSPDERMDSPTSSSAEWSNSVQHTAEVCQEFISKGPPKAEVQLR